MNSLFINRYKNFESIFKKLVSYKSISKTENIPLIKYVRRYLTSYGIKSSIIKGNSYQSNLYAHIGPNNENGIMFSGHTDVVPVTGQSWDSDPFTMEINKNNYIGRGTCDMKGFIAVVLSIIPEIQKSKLKKPIQLMFSYDEEIGCVGIQKAIPFLKSLKYKPKYCVVGEPTEMKVINEHKGKKNFVVTFNGVEAHSSLVNEGVNAINFASDFIIFLKKMQKELQSHDNLDNNFYPNFSSINIGKIKGGIAINIIPKKCKVEFEIRNLPKTDLQILLNRIKNFLKNLEKKMKKLNENSSINLTAFNSFPPLNTDHKNEIVKISLNASKTNNTGSVSFGTEAGIFNNLGINTVVCGPGSIAQAHKPNEFVSRLQIEKCSKFIEKIINSLY